MRIVPGRLRQQRAGDRLRQGAGSQRRLTSSVHRGRRSSPASSRRRSRRPACRGAVRARQCDCLPRGRSPAIPARIIGDRSMADMRLIVAGAGGRMGRTLVKAIAETKGLVLAGAVDAPGSPVIGQDSGELAGLGKNGVAVAADVRRRCSPRPTASIDFTSPGGDRGVRGAGRRRQACTSSAPPAFGRERAEDRGGRASSAAIVKSGNMSLGRQSARGADQARGEDARRGVRHRDLRDASQQEDRCAVRHRADVRPRGGRRPRHRSRAALGARPRRRDRRAQDRRHRLCVAARRHRGRRAQRDLRRPGRAHRAGAHAPRTA